MSEAIRIIRAEHLGIWQILNTFEDVLDEMAHADSRPDSQLLEAILNYLQCHADSVHHPKEDQHLFPAIIRRVPEARAIVDQLEQQHAENPVRIEQLRQALARVSADESGLTELRRIASDYIRFQREHLNLEEASLLPLARQHLTAEDWAPIEAAFQRNDDPLFGVRVREEFRALRSRIASHAPAPLGLGVKGDFTSPSRIRPSTPVVGPEGMRTVLAIDSLSSRYGQVTALKEVSLEINTGEIVALVGANGAGKTTLLRTISGLQPASGGRILYRGQDITRLHPARRVTAGISHVPEGRQVFGPMSVEDNLILGAYTRPRGKELQQDLEQMYQLFPILREKRRIASNTLSGGQQQMLAIARALMARPRLLLLDEPSMGLAPLIVAEIFDIITRLKDEGITIFLVEQNATAALAIADKGCVLENGTLVKAGPADLLREDEDVQRAYLGM